MDIIGHGIDCVDIARIEPLVKKNDDFLDGWFTPHELSRLGDRSKRPDIIAGRVACKEAVVKALGCGFNDNVAWHDVEILSSESGPPTVVLSGGAAAEANAQGVSRVFVSISNERAIAVASAIAVGITTPRT